MTTVELRELTKVFSGGTVAVDRLTLSVAQGEFLVLLGPSGCGKSTILRMIAGLEPPTSGEVLLDGRNVADLAPADRRVAMVFQNYALYPHLSVEDNIGFPLWAAGVEPEERARKVAEVAEALGIGDLLDRQPRQLSGGQQQRIAMGRAIARQPSLFLMDEPLSNLDTGLRVSLRAEILTLTREAGITTVYVTHDQTEALTMADRVAVLRQGVLHDLGTPSQIYQRPATLYTAAFLGSPPMNLLEARVHVYLDQQVSLELGGQTLNVPWADPHARGLARYHGERVVVGLRPDAVVPAGPRNNGPILHGRVRHIEHHGHESLAFVDIGAPTVAVQGIGERPAAASQPSRAGGRGRFGRGRAGRTGADRGSRRSGDDGSGAHRDAASADLVVRLDPYPSLRPGEQLPLRVRLAAAHFFDPRGNRIEPSHWR